MSLALSVVLSCAVLAGLFTFNLPAAAQTLAHRGWAGSGLNVDPWWQDAVFYQVNPSLFADAHDDGADPFATLAGHLDYLKSLDIDALVLTPFHLKPHPQSAVPEAAARPQESFESLVAEASRRHLRILVDLPLGDQPAQSTLASARFWLGRGVAGFRLTSPQSTAPFVPSVPVPSVPVPSVPVPSAPADIVRLLRDLRAVCAGYAGDRVLLWAGELPFTTLANSASSAAQEPASSPLHRQTRRVRHLQAGAVHPIHPASSTASKTGPQLEAEDGLERLPALNAMELRATLIGAGITGSHPRALPVFVTDAADRTRSFERYSPVVQGNTAPPLASARLLATVLFTTSAVPMLYFGQEIGLPGQPLAQPVQAIAGTRATMPWGEPPDSSAAAPPGHKTEGATLVSVAAEDDDPNSLLNFYRHLSSLRHANPALRAGSFQLLGLNQPDIVAWVRTVQAGGPLRPPVVVICSLSAQAQEVPLDAELHRAGFTVPAHTSMRTLLDTRPAEGDIRPAASTAGVPLEPYGVFVGELSSRPGLEHTVLPRRHRTRRHHR